MLVMFSVYIPILLFTDNVQAAVMITGLVIAIGVGVLAKRPGLAWLNNFVMAFSMLGGLVGIFIIVMLPIGILTSYVLWKKGKIQVVDKEQK